MRCYNYFIGFLSPQFGTFLPHPFQDPAIRDLFAKIAELRKQWKLGEEEWEKWNAPFKNQTFDDDGYDTLPSKSQPAVPKETPMQALPAPQEGKDGSGQLPPVLERQLASLNLNESLSDDQQLELMNLLSSIQDLEEDPDPNTSISQVVLKS